MTSIATDFNQAEALNKTRKRRHRFKIAYKTQNAE